MLTQSLSPVPMLLFGSLQRESSLKSYVFFILLLFNYLFIFY